MSKTILLISSFSLEKVKNYTIFIDFGYFSTFFSIAIFISAASEKIENLRQISFFLLPLFISGGLRHNEKKGNCSALC